MYLLEVSSLAEEYADIEKVACFFDETDIDKELPKGFIFFQFLHNFHFISNAFVLVRLVDEPAIWIQLYGSCFSSKADKNTQYLELPGLLF